jgi:hypothetical protein
MTTIIQLSPFDEALDSNKDMTYKQEIKGNIEQKCEWDSE